MNTPIKNKLQSIGEKPTLLDLLLGGDPFFIFVVVKYKCPLIQIGNDSIFTTTSKSAKSMEVFTARRG